MHATTQLQLGTGRCTSPRTYPLIPRISIIHPKVSWVQGLHARLPGELPEKTRLWWVLQAESTLQFLPRMSPGSTMGGDILGTKELRGLRSPTLMLGGLQDLSYQRRLDSGATCMPIGTWIAYTLIPRIAKNVMPLGNPGYKSCTREAYCLAEL